MSEDARTVIAGAIAARRADVANVPCEIIGIDLLRADDALAALSVAGYVVVTCVRDLVVWVVVNSKTYSEAQSIAVFTSVQQAQSFADARNTADAVFFVRRHVVDQWTGDGTDFPVYQTGREEDSR